MVSASLVASVLTLLPAMGLIYWVLHRYEGYFEQNRLFFGLIVGLFGGLLVRFLESVLFRFDDPTTFQPSGGALTLGALLSSAAYSTIGYALVGAMAMTAVLGFRKFRARKDTPYYGVAFGLAFGAMYAMPLFAYSLTPLVETQGLRLDATALAFDLAAFAFATGIVMAHGAAAVWVGHGSGQGRLWKGAVQGTGLLIPIMGISWFWVQNGIQLVPALASLGYGIFLTLVTQRRILDTIVPPEIRDQVRRERRRELRKGGA